MVGIRPESSLREEETQVLDSLNDDPLLRLHYGLHVTFQVCTAVCTNPKEERHEILIIYFRNSWFVLSKRAAAATAAAASAAAPELCLFSVQQLTRRAILKTSP